MCFSSIQKITSQTFRISGALVFLCTVATIYPKIFRSIVVYCFLIVFAKFRKRSVKEMRQEFERNSQQNKKLAFLISSFNQT
jgi:hypothetical protein